MQSQIMGCDNFVTLGEQGDPHKQSLWCFGFSYLPYDNSV